MQVVRRLSNSMATPPVGIRVVDPGDEPLVVGHVELGDGFR
jgi:hypothetical protein